MIGLQPFDEFEPLVGRRTSRDGQLLYECVLDRCVSYEWFDAQHVLFRYDGRAFFGRKCPETVGHLTIRVFLIWIVMDCRAFLASWVHCTRRRSGSMWKKSSACALFDVAGCI